MDLLPVLAQPVSRETLEALVVYSDLLKQWNSRINLVAPSTLATGWTRHIEDSAQIFGLPDQTWSSWVDLGSGGGFPGLVVSILSSERIPGSKVTLVEADQRKCAFLRTVVRELGLSTKVITARAEALDSLAADIVSARALAPLPHLLSLVSHHLAPHGKALLPKGANWRREIDEARKNWRFTYHAHPSKTDKNAVILEIGDIANA